MSKINVANMKHYAGLLFAFVALYLAIDAGFGQDQSSSKSKDKKVRTYYYYAATELKFNPLFFQVNVTYNIRYSDPVCSNDTAPDDVVVRIRRRRTALNVMERAVTLFGRDYRFSATYFGGELGYSINTINGTSSNLESGCFWFLFILDEGGNEIFSPFGVSNIKITKKQTDVIWQFGRYEHFSGGGSHV